MHTAWKPKLFWYPAVTEHKTILGANASNGKKDLNVSVPSGGDS